MRNLIKMDWYKLRTTKLFGIFLAILFVINAALVAAGPIVTKLFTSGQEIRAIGLSEAFANPISLSLLMIFVFISAISFLYSDFTGGFVKNIAGQVDNRGKMVISKFIVLGIHNCIFFVVGTLSTILGAVVGGVFTVDENILGGVMTFLLKWLLSMAIGAILLFMTMGMRNKTFASILGVVLATGTLSLVYMGINAMLANVFHVAGFDLGEYTPDSLMISVNAITNILVINALIVAVAFIALFVSLTYVAFKKRDVK